MTGSPELPIFDPAAFDAEFFSNYQKQLDELSKEDRASTVLAGILTIKRADGTEKAYEEIRNETIAFFASEPVKQDLALMNRMAYEFAQACMGHNHGSEFAKDEQLGAMFDRGISQIFGDKRDHKHEVDHKDEHKERKKSRKPSNTSIFGGRVISMSQKTAKSKPKKSRGARIIPLRPTNQSEVKHAA